MSKCAWSAGGTLKYSRGADLEPPLILGVRKMQYKLINFRIPEPLFREFKAKAALEGVSMTKKITEWIEAYVESEEE